MPTRDQLEPLYRRTTYQAVVEGLTQRIHVGRVHPELDACLSRSGARTWAFLTAWNPGSQRLTDEENRGRQAELAGRVAAAGLAAFPALGELGDWREESLLIVGLSQKQANAWAQEFGQAAFLWGEQGRPAELIWTPALPLDP